jgi:integrase
MAIEIRRDKNGNLKSNWWYGSYQVNGKRRVVNLNVKIMGEVPHSLREDGNAAFEQSRGQAQLALERHQRKAMTQKSTTAQLEQLYEIRTGETVGRVALSEMENKWLITPHARNRSERYVEQSGATIQQFIKYIHDHYPSVTSLDQITRMMAEAWLTSLNTLSPATYSDKLVLLRSVFKLLKHSAGMAWNPFEGLPTRKRQTIHRKPFTPAELKKIMEKADPLVRPIIITGICTAMRRGDCCLLKWADVDLKHGFVSVKTSKTGEMAEIPILPLLRKELVGAAQSRGAITVNVAEADGKGKAAPVMDADLSQYVWPEAAHMFLTNRYGITYRTSKAISDAKIQDTKAKVSDTRMASVKDFHSLRTTWITLALSAGVPMELVRRVSGHTTTDVVLKNYFRPGRKDFKKVIAGAMPALLTQGTIDVEAEEIPETPSQALEKALQMLEEMTGKTWKKQSEVVSTLVRQAMSLMEQPIPTGA